jgi:hypothetical protein
MHEDQHGTGAVASRAAAFGLVMGLPPGSYEVISPAGGGGTALGLG